MLGHRAVFNVAGGLLASHSPPGLTADLHIRRRDEGPETRVDLLAAFTGKPAALSVHAAFEEAAGGWVAAVLGWQGAGPLHLLVQGEGPIEAWKGKLDGSTQSYGSLQMAIRMEVRHEVALNLEGGYHAGELSLPPQLAPLLGPETRFGMAFSSVSPQRVVLDRADFQGAGYHLQLDGSLDLDAPSMNTAFTLNVNDLNVLHTLVGVPLAGEMTLCGDLSGLLQQPHGNLLLEMHQVETEALRVQAIAMDLQFEPRVPATSSFSGWQVTGRGNARDLASRGGKPLPESGLQWSLDLEVAPDRDISIHAFEVQGEHHLLKLTGQVNPVQASASLDTRLNINDLRPLTTFLGKELSGTARIAAQVTGSERDQLASGHIEGELNRPGGLPEALALLSADELSFAGDFAFREGSKLTLSELSVKSPVMQLAGQGHADFAAQVLEGNWRLLVPKLEALAEGLGRPLSGSVTGEGAIKGRFTAFEAAASLTGSALFVDGRKFDRVLASVNARNVPQAPAGDLRCELFKGGDKLEASTGFKLLEERLTLAPVAIKAPGSAMRGQGTVDLQTYLVQGNLEGKFSDLSRLGRLFGEPMGGNAELHARFSPGKQGQDVNVSLEAAGLATRLGKTKAIKLSANLKNVLQVPQGTVDLQLQTLQNSGLVLESLNFKASGDAGRMDFHGAVRGRTTANFDLQSRGSWQRSKAADRFQIESLKGHFSKYPLDLLQPFAIERSAAGLSLEKIVLALGPGHFEAAGRFQQKAGRLAADFDKLPLALSTLWGGPDIAGWAGGNLQLDGELSKPTVKWHCLLTEVRFPRAATDSMAAASLTSEGELANGKLNSTLELRGLAAQPGRASFTLPVNFSLTPYSLSVPPDGQVQGSLDAQTDLATVIQIFPLTDQKLSGQTTVHVELQGTAANPQFSGRATLENGSYQNLVHGTLLKEVTATLLAKERRLEIESVRATDGNQGTISAKGWVELDQGRQFPLQLEATLLNAKLLRRDDAAGTVGGDLKLTGSLKTMVLAGKLKVGPAEFAISNDQPDLVAAMNGLQVIDIHGPGEGVAAQSQSEASAPLRIGLDLDLNLPGQVFVKGRGLKSEWRGDLHLAGAANTPAITGVLTLVRGSYDFLDRRFTLVEGVIRFFGEKPPNPNLDLTAEAKTKDITARLSITGSTSAPKIELQSVPALPADEILARILFGRDLSSITPFQAVRLATALETLSGRSNLLDFMAGTRKLLGVQQLELTPAEGSDKGFGVGIGKYLTEDVYVHAEKEVGSESGKVSVEVDITPNLTLESQTGLNADTGIGINWKYDY